MLSALTHIFLNLLFITGLTLIATGLGRILLCRGDIKIGSFSECTVFSAGLGFGILSYTVFFLSTFQLLHPTALSVLLGLCAALSIGAWPFLLPNSPEIFPNDVGDDCRQHRFPTIQTVA